MTHPNAQGAGGTESGLLTRVARAAARFSAACAGRLTVRRSRVAAPVKLLLAILYVGPFGLMYGLLKLHVLLRGPLESQGLARWGSRFATRLPDMIQTYIYLFGLWEPDITAFIRTRLAPGDTFVDVGANVGYHALLAATQLQGAGRVVAIEASPGIFRMLRHNLSRNGDPAVIRAVNMAAADNTGAVQVYRGPVHNVGLTTTLRSRGLEPEARVAAAPLADLLEPQEIETARLVKIDVEGGEDRVLKGMTSFLERCPAGVEIIIELSPVWWNDATQTAQQVLGPLLRAGFHAYRIENNLWPWRYLWPDDVRRPKRVRAPLTKRVKRIDLVLSRLDQEEL